MLRDQPVLFLNFLYHLLDFLVSQSLSKTKDFLTGNKMSVDKDCDSSGSQVSLLEVIVCVHGMFLVICHIFYPYQETVLLNETVDQCNVWCTCTTLSSGF